MPASISSPAARPAPRSPSSSAVTLRFLRQVHLYVGLFISPALLFFALTGALQTFSLHETTPGSTYKPPAWIVTLAQIHKKQTASVPIRKPRPADRPASDKPADRSPAGPAADAVGPREHKAAPAPASPTAPVTAVKPKSHLPLKIFFLLVALGLFTSTCTGIYMAYRYARNKLLVSGVLLAGIALPLLLLPL